MNCAHEKAGAHASRDNSTFRIGVLADFKLQTDIVQLCQKVACEPQKKSKCARGSSDPEAPGFFDVSSWIVFPEQWLLEGTRCGKEMSTNPLSDLEFKGSRPKCVSISKLLTSGLCFLPGA